MDAVPTKEDCAKAAKVTESFAKERFPDAKIVRVDVELDDYSEDKPLLWLYIVLDTPIGVHLDKKASIEFQMDLDPKLRENGIFADSVVTYESYEEEENAA